MNLLMNKSKERKSEEEDRNLLFLKSLLPHFTLIPQQHILRVRRRLETLVEELAYPQSTNGGSESNTFTYSSYQAYHDVPQYMPSSYQTSPQSSDNTGTHTHHIQIFERNCNQKSNLHSFLLIFVSF